MASEEKLNELTELIRGCLTEDPGELKAETTLESLGVDSLELVEIIMSIEEKYDTYIEVDAVEAKENIKTIGDILALGQKFGIDTA